MKKFLIVLVTLFFIFAAAVGAQELTAQRAYDDYIFTLQKYEDAHQEYMIAKNAYLQNKTLNLQNQAQAKTATMLTVRDEVVKAHLTAIRAALAKEQGLSAEEKSPLLTGIDEEVAWWEARSSAYEAAATLSELANKSKEAKSRYEINAEYVIYKSLFWTSVAKTRFILGSERNLLVDLRNKVGEIAGSGEKDTSTIEKWFVDIEDRFNQSEIAEDKALAAVVDLERRYTNRQSVYNRAVSREEEAFLPLIEAKDFFKEIIRVIKTAD